MSKTRLEMAENLNQIASDQWAALAGILGKVADRDPLDVVKDALRGTITFTVEIVRRLSDTTTGALFFPRTNFNAKKAFKTRRGHRWSSDNLTKKILPLSKTMTKVPEIVTNYHTLETNTSEWDIMKEFPECVYDNINLLLAHMDSLTDLQPKGEVKGDLLVDNYKANLFFFVPDSSNPHVGFVVDAHWHSDGSEWHFSAYPLDGHVWDAGYRVFSNC